MANEPKYAIRVVLLDYNTRRANANVIFRVMFVAMVDDSQRYQQKRIRVNECVCVMCECVKIVRFVGSHD